MDILLYSIDPALAILLRAALEGAYVIREIATERRLIAALVSGPVGAILLDGATAHTIELCQRLRSSASVPILVIASGDAAAERVRFLRAGADDVLARSFHFAEFIARLQAKLRRAAGEQECPQSDQPLAHIQRSLLQRPSPLHLSPTEFQLLAALQSHAGAFVPASELQRALWGNAAQPGRVRYHISQLRRRLADVQDTVQIETQRGLGYRLVVRPGTLC